MAKMLCTVLTMVFILPLGCDADCKFECVCCRRNMVVLICRCLHVCRHQVKSNLPTYDEVVSDAKSESSAGTQSDFHICSVCWSIYRCKWILLIHKCLIFIPIIYQAPTSRLKGGSGPGIHSILTHGNQSVSSSLPKLRQLSACSSLTDGTSHRADYKRMASNRLLNARRRIYVCWSLSKDQVRRLSVD